MRSQSKNSREWVVRVVGKAFGFLTVAFMPLTFGPLLLAEVPQVISYQSRIAVDGVNFTGAGQFKFALVDRLGTSTFWSNDGSSSGGGQPTNAVPLSVTNGLCSVLLGDASLINMTAIPVSVFANSDVRLRVWFHDGTHGWQQLTPDERIASVGYAMVADTAVTVPSGAITAAKFAAGAVVGNLSADGESGVPSGGLVLSLKEDPSLVSAGYVKIGTSSSSDSWNSYLWKSGGTPTAGTAPATRFGHRAVWTGSEMIVWGGNNGGTWFDDGGRYRPSTNSWAPTNPSGTPTARVSHLAAWTGSEMIVWGGQDRNATNLYPTDPFRYNPISNTWTAGSSTNAPEGRTSHSLVWTGTDLIVWGGMDSNGNSLNTGGRYNPSTNTWTPITTNGAPGARRAHTAVWTGGATTQTGEMIIWGGTAPPDWLNDGARYNPATDSWSGMAIIGAPVARSGHSAVWTGSEMLIWGGQDGTDYFTDVRHYSPFTNRWTTGTSNDAPVGRVYHSAVWTGEEMIVWGGFGTEGRLNIGGRYDATNNRWTVITDYGAPSSRWGHTAVWTGAEMIVWGGQGSNSYLNDTWYFTPTRTMHLYQKP